MLGEGEIVPEPFLSVPEALLPACPPTPATSCWSHHLPEHGPSWSWKPAALPLACGCGGSGQKAGNPVRSGY